MGDERRPAETPDVFHDIGSGKRLGARWLDDGANGLPSHIPRLDDDAEGLPYLDRDTEANRHRATGIRWHERTSGSRLQRSAHDAEYPVSRRHRPGERESHVRSCRSRRYPASAHGEILRRRCEPTLPRPELEHVSGVERFVEVDRRQTRLRRCHPSYRDTTIVGPRVRHEVLAALTAQVPAGESSTEHLGKRSVLRIGDFEALRVSHSAVERIAIHPCDHSDVLGALHPAFDLDSRDTRSHQLRKEVDSGQITRTEQVATRRFERATLFVDQVIREPARLGT